MRYLLVLILLFGSCVDVGAEAPFIHILMYSDTADTRPDGIGEGCQATIVKTQEFFRALVPRNRYSLTVYESARHQYSAQDVLRTIERVQVGPQDTFVFLYQGHGASHNGRHYLASMTKGDALWSSELQNAVKKKSCRLKLILTDSCNYDPATPPAAADGGGIWDPERDGIAPVIESLFLNHHGLLHMNSAQRGQVSFTNRFTGSWFFDEFIDYCRHNQRARPTWRMVDEHLDQALGLRFRGRWGTRYSNKGIVTTGLGVVWWSMAQPDARGGGGPGVAGQRVPLGISLKNCDSRGVHVTSVSRGSPATRMRDQNSGENISLEPGDHIISVNGIETSDKSQVVSLVNGSASQVELTVLDRRTGRIRRLAASLIVAGNGGGGGINQIVLRPVSNRLGIDCHLCRSGIHVDNVYRGGAATRMRNSHGQQIYLEQGDHILSIDGQAVNSIEDYKRALSSAPSETTITIRNKRGGIISRFAVSLSN